MLIKRLRDETDLCAVVNVETGCGTDDGLADSPPE